MSNNKFLNAPRLLLGALLTGLTTTPHAQSNVVHGDLIEFNDNGAWCWYQDERAIVDNGKIILASIAHQSGTGGSSRHGNMEITTYDIAGDETTRNVLHRIGADDHNVAAIMKRPDGRYLAVYATHGNNNDMYWNISEPENSTQWGNTNRTSVGEGNTYSNVFRLSDEGRTYNFHRGRGWNPNAMISDDDGDSWTYGGRLIEDSGRPYLKYASNNVDVIHFTNTEQHPRDYDNSIYHGYVRDGKTYNSTGQVIDNNFFDASGPRANAFTKVYQGGSNNVAWTADMQLDSNENPFVGFTVQRNRSQNDLRYHYAYWDGSEWTQHEIAYAGTALYDREQDYTGNIALHPNNPDVVYISTDADPETGDPLISSADNRRHYELFKGTTENRGEDWVWEPITENSNTDNIRPVVPIWNTSGSGIDSTALLWMRGTYSSYTDWNMDMVGLIFADTHVVSVSKPGPQQPGIRVDASGLQVSLAYSGDYNLELVDIRGRKAARFSATGPSVWRLSRENLRAGVYLLKVALGDDSRMTHKIVVP